MFMPPIDTLPGMLYQIHNAGPPPDGMAAQFWRIWSPYMLSSSEVRIDGAVQVPWHATEPSNINEVPGDSRTPDIAVI
jgi:hypothetical protein